MTFYVRTGGDGYNAAVAIDDLGVTIETGVPQPGGGTSWTLLSAGDDGNPNLDGYGQFTARELRNSEDLYDLIIATTLEYSLDGSTEETKAFVSDIPLMRDYTDDHFDLTGGRLTLPNDTNPPANITDPLPGDLLYDTDDGYLTFYSGVLSQWITITDSGSVVSDHGALTGLLDDDHTQYALLSGNAARNPITGKFDWGTDAGELGLPKSTDPTSAFGSAAAGDLAYDTDDGYVVFYDGANWIALESAAAVNDHGALTGLLDDDHTQYGLLAGNAARNAVTGTYDFTDGYLINPVSTVAPTDNLVDGSVTFIDGVMYSYDATRAAWLSIDRKFVTGGKSGNAIDVYLRISDGIASSQTGFRALRDGTIVGMFAQADTSSTWDLEVRLNGSTSPSATLSLAAVSGNQDTTTNVNFSQGDEIQLFVQTTPGNTAKAPIAGVEIAWRV